MAEPVLDLLQTIVDGLLFGSTYALVAIGFTLIWGLLLVTIGILIFTDQFTIIARWLTPYLPTF